MGIWIKICGIKTVEAALSCAEAGADAVGFVFAESRRRISVETAAGIIAVLPTEIDKAGVFVDMPYQDVAEIERCLGLDLLQFHGQESPHYCSLFPGKAVKSFRIASAGDLKNIEAYRGKIRACLLDSFQPGQAGGTGSTWDWDQMNPDYAEQMLGFQFIVAGGITAHNVTEALQKLKPYGIDASSGLEIDGQKDHGLIKNFVQTVRRWENGKLA